MPMLTLDMNVPDQRHLAVQLDLRDNPESSLAGMRPSGGASGGQEAYESNVDPVRDEFYQRRHRFLCVTNLR